MLRKLRKNKKAQNTAEYAILISLVVAGIIAMQTYAQRALQAKVRDASQILADSGAGTNGIFDGTIQYEPYYLETNYTVNRSDETTRRLGTNQVAMDTNSATTRLSGGKQTSAYDVGKWNQLINGL